MGILNRLFESTADVAKEIKASDEDIIKHWKHYLSTVARKKEILEHMWTSLEYDFQSNIDEVRKLLELELVDISSEEKDEAELISDLERLEHSEKIRRVHRLEECLGYAATKYEYVYGLLMHLHTILKNQMHLVKLTDFRNIEKSIFQLKLQLNLELEILKKIDEIQTFHDLFLALVKGEHIIKTMDAREKKLLKKMLGAKKVFSYELKEGITYEWAMTVYNAIEDKVHEAVANEMIAAYHPGIDFEFVNRPEFVELARESIQKLKKREVSTQMINTFVHMFREWYNYERG